METIITDLPVDAVTSIMEAVAKSQDGSLHLAQSMTICQHFLKASDSDLVFRSASFQNVRTIYRTHLFQNTNGLLSKCAKAGNPRAVHLLAQVILVSSSQLLEFKTIKKADLKYFRNFKPKYKNGRRGPPREDQLVAAFVSHFTPAPGSHPIPKSNPLCKSFHWECGRAFILNCTANESLYMWPYLHDYVELFAPRSIDVCPFLFRLASMRRISYSLGIISTEVVDRVRLAYAFEEVRASALQWFDIITPNLQ